MRSASFAVTRSALARSAAAVSSDRAAGLEIGENCRAIAGGNQVPRFRVYHAVLKAQMLAAHRHEAALDQHQLGAAQLAQELETLPQHGDAPALPAHAARRE